MTNGNTRIMAIARWFAIILSIVFAAYCVYLLASIATAHAIVLAIVCGSVPLAAWLEASRLRSSGHPEASDSFLITAAGVQLVLMLLVSYAAELAQLGANCPPQ